MLPLALLGNIIRTRDCPHHESEIIAHLELSLPRDSQNTFLHSFQTTFTKSFCPRVAGEKVAILDRHLIDKVPVSTLCDEEQFRPTVFCRWLKQFFENEAAAFGLAPRADKQVEAREQRIAFLRAS
jgi:hypothetical protein